MGLIHVFWFAASNHNLNQYLTWVVCFFYLASYSIKPISNIALRSPVRLKS
jgi:hypothetical protein